MKSHDVPAPTWIAVVAILVLIATHVVLLRVFSRAQLSLAFLAGLIGVVVLKYVWWSALIVLHRLMRHVACVIGDVHAT